MGLLPELTAPAELYYNEKESKNYNNNSRITKIQGDITQRALDLLKVDCEAPLFLDIGCGGGLSGQVLSENGYEWVGVDISQDMLSVARQKSKNLGLIQADIGEELPFKEESFDYAISISAVQWLFQSYKNEHVPIKRVRTFFRSLYNVVRRSAAIQFYCGKKEIEILKCEAKKAGFYGGIVIDDEGSKNVKHFLILEKFRRSRDVKKYSRQLKKRRT